MPTQLRDVLETGSKLVIGEDGNPVSRDKAAERYYAQRVVVRNDSDIAFCGPPATVNGIETPIPARGEEVMSLGDVYEILGNPHYYNGDRNQWRKEHDLRNKRFVGRRVHLVIPVEQIEAQDRLITMGRMKPEDAIPKDVPIPTLVVLDRQSGMVLEPEQGWPLYNADPRPLAPVRAGVVSRAEYDALVARIDERETTEAGLGEGE